MKPIRVAIVMPMGEQRGGAEMLLMHFLRSNAARPLLEATLAFFEDGPMRAEIAALGYPTRVFPAGHLRQVGRYVGTVQALQRWLKSERSEVVLSWATKSHLYAGLAARRLKLPAAWWQHGISHGHWMDRLGTRVPSQAVFCCSEQARQAQTALGKCNARVVYPGVDLARFDPAVLPTPEEARRLLNLPREGRFVGTVCRLQSQKGVHILLEAAVRLRNTHPDTHFIIVGGAHPLEPEYAAKLRRQAVGSGLADRIHFVGAQADIPLWMQTMTCFVLPAVGLEGFGMVLVEAMALGKVVIASDSGGPREIITHGKDGFLTPVGDSKALAETLTQALQPDAGLDGLREAARARAQVFSLQRFHETLVCELERTMERK